jgi:hypothetical protein
MPETIKIGITDNLERRIKELDNTSVALPFECYYAVEVKDASKIEKKIHEGLDDKRIRQNREFFNISPEKAYEILLDIELLLGEEAEVDLFGDNVEIETRSPKGNRTKGERFDFYVKGLKDGDQVTFIDDKSIVAIVANSRQVLFEGELWYLSALARELYTRRNQVSLSGSYQGPAYFLYNGTKLNEIKRLQTE